MIRRCTIDDVEEVNRWLGRDFPGCDFTEVLKFDRNVCLCKGEGGAIFVWRGPNIYEVHCFFEQRGKEVRDLSKEILGIMARDYGARLVWAAIPDNAPKVKVFVRWLGFKPVDHANFVHGPCQIFTWENP